MTFLVRRLAAVLYKGYNLPKPLSQYMLTREATVSLSLGNAKRLHASELERIERILRFVANRNGLSAEESEEFQGEAHLRLIENDFHVIRAFDGRSKFSTYMTTVALRLIQDFRTQRWGRWRPSAAARRAGDIGIRLETLVVRDGFTFDEAVKILSQNHGVTTPRERLHELLHSFPLRHGRASRQRVALESVPEPKAPVSAEDRLRDGELGALEERLVEALTSGIETLDSQDQLILRMVFLDGHRISGVAKLLRLEARPLYRRIAALSKTLRGLLERQGVTAREFQILMEAQGGLRAVDLSEVFDRGPSNEMSRESGSQESTGP